MLRNREDAARKLAKRLKQRELRNPLVLCVPRGGVAVGAVLAEELEAELDVVLASKLRAPMQRELAIGAVSEDGEVYLNSYGRGLRHINERYLQQERLFQLEKIRRRRQMFREIRPQAEVSGRSVIVTDDGIATGSTMIAALELVRLKKPYELISAIPVAPPDRLRDVATLCDAVVCLEAPFDFLSVGDFYEEFCPVDDQEAVTLVRLAYQTSVQTSPRVG